MNAANTNTTMNTHQLLELFGLRFLLVPLRLGLGHLNVVHV